MKKFLTALIFLKNGQAVRSFKDMTVIGDIFELAEMYNDSGIDRLMIFDLSEEDTEHELNLKTIKELVRLMEISVLAGGHVNNLEDIKRLIYNGVDKVIVNCSKASASDLAKDGSERFGKDKIIASIGTVDMFFKRKEIVEYIDEFFVLNELVANSFENITELNYTVYLRDYTFESCVNILKKDKVMGVCGAFINDVNTDIMKLKARLLENGIDINRFETSITWDQFKLNSDGLIPVVVQDYKTSEVLMLAYMDEEAFYKTLELGKMTYHSRSRNELWTKGLTSGHLQYVKSLTLDCDNDTILAKVSQVGGIACHTGSPSCFFKTLVEKPYDEKNPLKIFEQVYDTILDRKESPKQGSYTNELFDKGIDEILKKVADEFFEIMIAAKNNDNDSLTYEIADFLYHAMVLMANQGVTWEDISAELAQR